MMRLDLDNYPIDQTDLTGIAFRVASPKKGKDSLLICLLRLLTVLPSFSMTIGVIG